MRKFVALLVVIPLVAGLGVVVSAQSARAWPWSSTVTVTGALNQCTKHGIQVARVNAVLNGQRHVYTTPAGQPPSYSVTFTNVPSGAGGWAWIVIDCSVVGGSKGYWVKVYRPGFGSTLRVNL
jgi:hypothetical protein